MTWYSYFLLSVPESFSMIILTFTLLGISIKKNIRAITLFSFLFGAIAFTVTILMTNSIKPFITFIAFSLLVTFIFKFKLINGFIIGVISFICLMFLEILFIPVYMKIFSLTYESLLANSWHMIFASLVTAIIPMFLITFTLKKMKRIIKVPLLFK